MAQSLVLTLLGGALLRISALSTTYLNYVKPGFRPLLIAAGLVVFLLGVMGLVQEWRRPFVPDRRPPEHGPWADGRAPDAGAREASEDGRDTARENSPDDGHAGHAGHRHGPRVAWLLCLPVMAIFLITPPALGSFAAGRDETPQPRPTVLDGYGALAGDRVTVMPLGEFIGRAWGDTNRSLTGKPVRLAGFVARSKKRGQWYLTRMQLRCCAADAFPLRVAVVGVAPPPDDTWVEVTGTWVATPYDKLPKGTVAPEMKATGLTRVDQPAEPYE
ncbi:TIGR03943 family protein [Sphaerisporangium sp. TRM90804]|uniref:TIGR03943 family putative permease subunit n=1 Tax=Sphaerisporangium sp. TRM90804 TaxID=3031113 RepID=UPI0024470F29|nr:TIGR03943 family protein [Sphaerisporangium sp. TRM90804]MDH2425710.1 TIGR03943 family protein [Sphaerisporangium sp. TRM90804]